MRRIISILISLCLLLVIASCGKQSESESKPKLSEWQTELLEAKGLPTEYDNLTSEQKHFIDRVGEIIDYLNQKYDEEFIYYDYKPAELMDSEKLYAYPKSTGIGNGKYLVTVKARNGGFEDDYHDFSVGALAEDMVNDFLLTQFKEDEFKLIHKTYACDIKMSEIENGDFQWKYGGFWGLFIDEKVCDMEHVEEFAVKFAKWLYEHRLDGKHRIQILHEYPTDEKIWSHYDDLYSNKNNECAGYYVFSFDSSKKGVHTSICIHDLDDSKTYRNNQDHTLKEFFSKYN